MSNKSTYNQVNKLLVCSNLDDAKNTLDIFLHYFFDIIQNHTEGEYGNQIKPHAKIMHQMVFMKTLHLKQILGGEPYENLPHLIDPGVIAILCRNILETVGVFHLIYVKTKSDEERELLYYIWVHAGLRNRQEYKESFTITDQSEKLENERAIMNEIVEIVNQNSV